MSIEKTERTLRWNVIALAFAGPALLAVIIWIMRDLTPEKWCGVLIGAAREAQLPAPECTSILLQLLKVHRDAVWILGGTLGLVIVAIGLAATGMTFKGRIAGNDLSMGRDNGRSAAAKEVAGAAADKAADITEETA